MFLYNVQKKRLYYYLHALHTAGLETECMHEQHTQAYSHVGQSSGSDGLPLLSTHPLSPFRKTSSTSSSLSNVFISLVAFCCYIFTSVVFVLLTVKLAFVFTHRYCRHVFLFNSLSLMTIETRCTCCGYWDAC